MLGTGSRASSLGRLVSRAHGRDPAENGVNGGTQLTTQLPSGQRFPWYPKSPKRSEVIQVLIRGYAAGEGREGWGVRIAMG